MGATSFPALGLLLLLLLLSRSTSQAFSSQGEACIERSECPTGYLCLRSDLEGLAAATEQCPDDVDCFCQQLEGVTLCDGREDCEPDFDCYDIVWNVSVESCAEGQACVCGDANISARSCLVEDDCSDFSNASCLDLDTGIAVDICPEDGLCRCGRSWTDEVTWVQSCNGQDDCSNESATCIDLFTISPVASCGINASCSCSTKIAATSCLYQDDCLAANMFCLDAATLSEANLTCEAEEGCVCASPGDDPGTFQWPHAVISLQGFVIVPSANGNYVQVAGDSLVNGHPTYWSSTGWMLWWCGGRYWGSSPEEYARRLHGGNFSACDGSFRAPLGADRVLTDAFGSGWEEFDGDTSTWVAAGVSTEEKAEDADSDSLNASSRVSVVLVGSAAAAREIICLEGFADGDLNRCFARDSTSSMASGVFFSTDDQSLVLYQCPDCGGERGPAQVACTSDFLSIDYEDLDTLALFCSSSPLATTAPGASVLQELFSPSWYEGNSTTTSIDATGYVYLYTFEPVDYTALAVAATTTWTTTATTSATATTTTPTSTTTTSTTLHRLWMFSGDAIVRSDNSAGIASTWERDPDLAAEPFQKGLSVGPGVAPRMIYIRSMASTKDGSGRRLEAGTGDGGSEVLNLSYEVRLDDEDLQAGDLTAQSLAASWSSSLLQALQDAQEATILALDDADPNSTEDEWLNTLSSFVMYQVSLSTITLSPAWSDASVDWITTTVTITTTTLPATWETSEDTTTASASSALIGGALLASLLCLSCCYWLRTNSVKARWGRRRIGEKSETHTLNIAAQYQIQYPELEETSDGKTHVVWDVSKAHCRYLLQHGKAPPRKSRLRESVSHLWRASTLRDVARVESESTMPDSEVDTVSQELGSKEDSGKEQDGFAQYCPAYPGGSCIEYYSRSQDKWIYGVYLQHAVSATGQINSTVEIRQGASKQGRQNVPLSDLRGVLQEGEAVEVMRRTNGTTEWVPCVMHGFQKHSASMVGGYTVVLENEHVRASEQQMPALKHRATMRELHELERWANRMKTNMTEIEAAARNLTAEEEWVPKLLRNVPSSRLRRRFDPGMRIEVYAGVWRGWIAGVVANAEEVLQIEDPPIFDYEGPPQTTATATASQAAGAASTITVSLAKGSLAPDASTTKSVMTVSNTDAPDSEPSGALGEDMERLVPVLLNALWSDEGSDEASEQVSVPSDSGLQSLYMVPAYLLRHLVAGPLFAPEYRPRSGQGVCSGRLTATEVLDMESTICLTVLADVDGQEVRSTLV